MQATVANILIFDDTPLYTYYGHVPRLWHLSASSDQNIAGSVMFLESMIVLLCAYGWALARFFTESEVRQILLERGAGESAATRAARYGRGVAHAHSTPATAYRMVEGPAVRGSDPQTAPGAPQTAPGSLGKTAPR